MPREHFRNCRIFNFVPQNQEEEPTHSNSSAPLTSNTCTLKISFVTTVNESTTDTVLENILLNDEDLSITMMCPSRASKQILIYPRF